jgi:hypothetical protein
VSDDGLNGDRTLSTGVNDHSWEREHRHPTALQSRAIGNRRRDAEAKLAQQQEQARKRTTE